MPLDYLAADFGNPTGPLAVVHVGAESHDDRGIDRPMISGCLSFDRFVDVRR